MVTHPFLCTGNRQEAKSGLVRGFCAMRPAGAAVEFIPDLCVRSSLFARHCVSQAVAVRNFFLCVARALSRDSSLRVIVRSRGTSILYLLAGASISEFLFRRTIVIDLRYRETSRSILYETVSYATGVEIEREYYTIDSDPFVLSFPNLYAIECCEAEWRRSTYTTRRSHWRERLFSLNSLSRFRTIIHIRKSIIIMIRSSFPATCHQLAILYMREQLIYKCLGSDLNGL